VDEGYALARATERVLRTLKMPPSLKYEGTDWKPGAGWVTDEMRTPGWIIHVLSATAVRLGWHDEGNTAYRVKRLALAAEALEGAGFTVTRVDDEAGRPLQLVVGRAAASWTDAT
jgi:hypothetical protein